MIPRLCSQALSWVDLTVAISRTTASSLFQNFHASRVEVVPMGIDDQRIDELSALPDPDQQYDFITVGRLTSYKRHSDFVAALSILKRRYGWKGLAAVVGSGPRFPVLIQQSRELGVESNIVFLGAVSEEAKFRALRSSRIFVLPSEREGFSLSTLEAMIVGLSPIVAKPVLPENFGVRDLVVPGVTGEVYPCGNTEALAALMHRLLDSPDERARLTRKGFASAQQFRWSRIVEGFEAILAGTVHNDVSGETIDRSATIVSTS